MVLLVNYLIPIGFILLALVFWYSGKDLPMDPSGPMSLPILWGSLLIIVSLLMIGQMIIKRKNTCHTFGNLKKLFQVVIFIILYILGIQWIGYYISSFLFLMVIMIRLSIPRIWIAFTVSLGWLLFSYIVFNKILCILLPVGHLVERYFG